ncbi:DUF4157 domain-containing protein [Fulvivirga sp. 29W222]|uniref:DUF4157 domain-containing protein n=1 Tax=Fulvivirga marina TaxID=2494733 RepID=A0A937FU38_9BACT|nr:DUF4157 domain-containing protein [Fulvivirga marina]MBL6445964.1 DUF4157 domain-containing protein [Fulvivirga marina]
MNDQFSGVKDSKSSVNRMNLGRSSLDSNFDNNNGLNANSQFADNLGQGQSHTTVQLQVSTNSGKAVQLPSKTENKTGLPDDLKSGVEELSGYSMDDVKVHFNSSKPTQMKAHAYAQGTDIHVGPGQEQHLPHEAWHVVQQKQGRVMPTLQMKGGLKINDDKGLEKEADEMGDRSLQLKSANASSPSDITSGIFASISHGVAQMKWVDSGDPVLAWDQPIDGVQWFYIKESGKMYYKIVKPDAIKLGNIDDYEALENQEKDYQFWKENSVVSFDIGAHLDSSVITPEEVEEYEQVESTGMEALDKGEYLGKAKELENEWGQKDTNQRAMKIMEAVNVALVQVGVPPITYTLKRKDEDSYGQFSEKEWSMELNELMFEKETIDKDTMAQIADTVFHEARHGEQFFRIARMLAAFGLDKQEILGEMVMNGEHVDENVVQIALTKPMALPKDGLTTELLETMHWYESLYGKKSKLRVHTIRTMKEMKLLCFQLKAQFAIIKNEMQSLKFDREMLPMDKEMELEEVKGKYRPVKQKFDQMGDEESEERTQLKLQKERLEQDYRDIVAKYKQLATQIFEKQKVNVEQQKITKQKMDIALQDYLKWHDLYEKLPEELDAWRVGGSIQEGYKLLL